MFRTLTACFFVLFTLPLFAQMPGDDGGIRYGNEWIDYERTYLAIRVAEDGMYRVSARQLSTLGNADSGYELRHHGRLVPVAQDGDGLLFYGEMNRGELDAHLFPDPAAMQLNDRYSMHTDTATYYLSVGGEGLNYQPATVNDPTPVTGIMRTSEVVFSDHYTKNFFRSSRISIYYSHYDVADGFGSLSSRDLLSEDGATTSEIKLPLPGNTGETATLDVRFGTAFGGHDIMVAADGEPLETITQVGWKVRQLRQGFIPSGDESTISLTGSRGDKDKANVAWARVTYPATTTYDEHLRSFTVPASATASRIKFTGMGGVAGATEGVKAFAPSSGTLVSGTADAAGTVTLDFPATSADVIYHFGLDPTYRNAGSETIDFDAQLPGGSTTYLLLTSRRLNGPSIEALANYRRSVAGGSYVVKVVNVEDLYEEYGYGVARHPMAVRNYVAAARLEASKLQYLFLVGKGREFPDLRTAEQLADARETFFLPSFGFPASDNLLTADLGSVVPNLSTGRLSAINESELAIYLKKLIDVEARINQGGQTIADRDWMKQVMHLGGGGNPGEQSSIKSRLARMEDSIVTTQMAANVTSFFKTSTEPIEESRQNAIFDRINDGTSVISFMGHSSNQGFDFSIEDPANYSNFGKYPFMISLGCYSGDAFGKSRSISERFLFLRDKGAIAFAASKGVGYISALGNWGVEMYKNIGEDTYGDGLGDAMRKSIQKFSGTSNFTLGILIEQFALSGDPAYRLHPRPGADLVIDPTSVSFEPEVVPAQDLDFTINFRLLNLGTKPVTDSITLRFRQMLPSGATIDLTTHRVAAPDYDQMNSLILPNVGFDAVGQNRVLISVDQDNEIVELPIPDAENNNELVSGGQLGVPLTVVANTARAAFPPRYGVIGGALEFIASTTNGLAPARNYTVQVSQERRFRNLIADEVINSPGGVIRYSPAFAPVDSTTYYWRISPDTTETQGRGYIWSESSFTWVADQPDGRIGWALQDPGQTVDGSFKNIDADTTTTPWSSTKNLTDIKLFNSVRNELYPRFEFDGAVFGSPTSNNIPVGLKVLIIDSLNSYDWTVNPGTGEFNTRPGRANTWNFDTRTVAGREGMITFIQEAIPAGKYVFVYTSQRSNTTEYYNDEWLVDSVNIGNSIFNVLEDQGALQIRRLTEVASVPYIFVYQQDMGALAESMALEQMDTVAIQVQLESSWPEGSWQSAKVGPALKWEGVNVGLSSVNLSAVDSVRFAVIGIGADGTETKLIEQDFDFESYLTLSLPLDQYRIEEYPFMRADFEFFDLKGRTTATVDYVYFDLISPGDVAINPQVAFSAPDSLDQGQPFVVKAAYENISRVDMDSMLVELTLTNTDNEIQVLQQIRGPLPAGAQDEFIFTVPTAERTSPFRYSVKLNPRRAQPEFVIFNNDLEARVKLGRDLIDPDLSVFFDGIRINDGDIVSGKPEILIQLRDENSYLPLNDTSAYVLELTSPDGQSERINFSDTRIEFLPATAAGENTADVFFRPELTQDGTYILEMLGQDRSGNIGGQLTLRQEFEVVNQQTVSNVLTYPNPFSTQTRFVYTLTGNELPKMFRIQIMTVSGRVVRDIDLLAMETLKIGTHQTDFAWDGTDEYGDLLANGVYLYRVITADDNGSMLEKRTNEKTAQYFENEIGKVVLIR